MDAVVTANIKGTGWGRPRHDTDAGCRYQQSGPVAAESPVAAEKASADPVRKDASDDVGISMLTATYFVQQVKLKR